jgi:hypothetical protein
MQFRFRCYRTPKSLGKNRLLDENRESCYLFDKPSTRRASRCTGGEWEEGACTGADVRLGALDTPPAPCRQAVRRRRWNSFRWAESREAR